MTARTSLTIVLAAGEGTRMRSAAPKVLHPVAGQSLLAHVLAAAPGGAGAALNRLAGRQHRMRGAETLALNESCGIGTGARDFIGNRLVIRPDHDGKRCAFPLGGGVQHMRQQRLAGHRMQHLWQ